jgi:hypothetical protein
MVRRETSVPALLLLDALCAVRGDRAALPDRADVWCPEASDDNAGGGRGILGVRHHHAASSMLSILVMVAGAAMAGATDLSFRSKGYAWVSICITSTAAYLILIRMIGKNTGLNQHALLLYNNLLSFPMILAWFMLFTDEPGRVLLAPQLQDSRFLAFLFVSVSQAFLLNLCIFWCTTANSPLATTIVGEFFLLFVLRRLSFFLFFLFFLVKNNTEKEEKEGTI